MVVLTEGHDRACRPMLHEISWKERDPEVLVQQVSCLCFIFPLNDDDDDDSSDDDVHDDG